jgi:L-alanine-DL-glutamate epimerase-like enolase superfamily enzyme
VRIVDIRETTVALGAAVRNAEIGFEAMTASALALVTDGPHVGFAFDSIGRYGHGALLRERFIPRLADARPEDWDDPFKIHALLMRNEKPGGHGERAGAVGLVDAALWDLIAKREGKPLWRVLAERFNAGRAPARVPAYASGGHYGSRDLAEELRGWRNRGYTRFKIKIGGAPLDEDRRRIEAALGAAGGGANLAVDGNGTFTLERAQAYLAMVAPYRLAWFEEPAPPLDFEMTRALAASSATPIGTGENLFSAADARNLLTYGGLDPARDWLQFDVSLSYGIPEYLRILKDAESRGWARSRFLPHAGHLFAFHVVAGLGLAGHEAAPDEATLLGGYPDGVRVEGGFVAPWDAPGVGFERKPNLYAVLRRLIG